MAARLDADEARIRGLVAEIVAGIRDRDLNALRPVYASDVVSFDVEPPLRHVGVEAKLENWARVFAVFRSVEYDVRDLTVVVGGDVAFGYCFGRLHGTLMSGAATDGMWVRVTLCFRRIGGDWLVVHDQASVPFDVVSGRGVADLEP